jgi:hypothetical protein
MYSRARFRVCAAGFAGLGSSSQAVGGQLREDLNRNNLAARLGGSKRPARRPDERMKRQRRRAFSLVQILFINSAGAAAHGRASGQIPALAN